MSCADVCNVVAPRTVGELVEERGLCAIMAKVADLAQVLKRLPAGEWDYSFQSDPRWRICLNGGQAPTWSPPNAPAIARFDGYAEFNGWPAGSFNAAGGVMVGDLEDALLAALDREVAAVRAPGS